MAKSQCSNAVKDDHGVGKKRTSHRTFKAKRHPTSPKLAKGW